MSNFDSYGSDAVYFEAVQSKRELRTSQAQLLLRASESVVLANVFGVLVRDRVNFPELQDQQDAIALAEDYLEQAGSRYKSLEVASEYVGQIISLHDDATRGGDIMSGIEQRPRSNEPSTERVAEVAKRAVTAYSSSVDIAAEAIATDTFIVTSRWGRLLRAERFVSPEEQQAARDALMVIIESVAKISYKTGFQDALIERGEE